MKFNSNQWFKAVAMIALLVQTVILSGQTKPSNFTDAPTINFEGTITFNRPINKNSITLEYNFNVRCSASEGITEGPSFSDFISSSNAGTLESNEESAVGSAAKSIYNAIKKAFSRKPVCGVKADPNGNGDSKDWGDISTIPIIITITPRATGISLSNTKTKVFSYKNIDQFNTQFLLEVEGFMSQAL